MQTQILASLEQIPITSQTLVLTANQRLALRTHQAYDKAQLTANKISWPTPSILPLNAWLTHHAHQHLQSTLLSNHQECYLWESIIRHSCDDVELLNPQDTAATAASAWQSLHLWCVAIDALNDHDNQEVAFFYQWALQFSKLLDTHNWITPAQIPGLLTPLIIDRLDHAYDHLLLIGFDELPPAIHTLMRTLENTLAITLIQIEKTPLSVVQTTLHDQQSEMQTMAYWAKQLHDANPQASIACVIPQLEQLRHSLVNVFSETFVPQQLLPGVPASEKLFNISAGQRMNEYPIIRCALDIINWLTMRIDSQHIGNTLQSPYLHQTCEEHDDGARLDEKLRALKEYELTFTAIFEVAAHTTQQTQLMSRLFEVKTFIKQTPPVASLMQWQHIFSTLLEIAGWPGYRTLNSDDYQLCMRWRQLLDEFITYQTVCDDTISLSQALHLLHKQAHNTIFQTEGSDANVQILGVLEAAGNHFDYLWVMGLDDECWPAKAQPNPFIPYQMQKTLHMPHATAQRELIYTQQMMHRLSHSASEIVFSSPRFEQDKRKNPSCLLQQLPYQSFDLAIDTMTTSQTQPLEMISDHQAPPMTADEGISTTSQMLKQQSECPFKAFAKIRLSANALNQPQFGISPAERGIMIHDALERMWQHLQTQTTLKQLSTTQLDHLLSDIIDKTVADFQRSNTSALRRHLLVLEKKRIQFLLQQWLAYEKQRPPFTIYALETTQQSILKNVNVNVRIDRIDTLDNGTHILIDYKTGETTLTAWFGERPCDPQLPLYLSLNQHFVGIVFAQLRNNQCRFKGVTNTTETAKKMPDTLAIDTLTKKTVQWEQQTEHWQHTIEKLADELATGIASVTPSDPLLNCARCDLQALCRVRM